MFASTSASPRTRSGCAIAYASASSPPKLLPMNSTARPSGTSLSRSPSISATRLSTVYPVRGRSVWPWPRRSNRITSATRATGFATVKYQLDRLSMTRPWRKTTVGSPEPSRTTWKSRPRTSTSAIQELLDGSYDLRRALQREQVAALELHDSRVRQCRRQLVGPRAEGGPGAVHAEDRSREAAQAGRVDGRLRHQVRGDGGSLAEMPRAIGASRAAPAAARGESGGQLGELLVVELDQLPHLVFVDLLHHGGDLGGVERRQRRVEDDYPPHALRVVEREAQRHRSAVAVAHDVDGPPESLHGRQDAAQIRARGGEVEAGLRGRAQPVPPLVVQEDRAFACEQRGDAEEPRREVAAHEPVD